MTFHDKRIRNVDDISKVTTVARRRLMLSGVRKINLWQHLPAPKLGTIADDWASVGNDIRDAMDRQALCD